MSKVWWMRHGPTHEKAFVGWRDVPADLSDTAVLQRISAFLPSQAIVISSDLSRASATADAITGDRLRLPHDMRLREFNFGDWDGMVFDDIARDHPKLSRRFWEEPGDVAPPGGESWNEVATRVNAAIDDIVAGAEGKPIIAVAHIGVIMTQIARAQGEGAYAAMGHKIDNLSLTEVTFTGKSWDLGMVNHIP